MTYHKRKNADAELVVKEDFVYDNQNRLLEHYHEVLGKSPIVSLAKNTYNEIGQLVKKEVGRSANTPLQTVNYTYNIRGWMTGINSGDIAYNAADESYVLNNGKLFGYNIRYNNPANPSLGAAKYNGNIAEIDWISRDVSLKRYGYQYDSLNRLLKGNYQDPGRALPESHINDEALTYDHNGNIKTLVRNSKHGKLYTPVVVDNLVYQYTGNRVTNITDASGNSSGYEGGGQTMSYDANGNTTAMPDKNISAIAYNILNLPNQINQNANVTNYYYRADGVKVRKKFVLTNSTGTKTINTEYLDGFQYSTPNTDPIRKALENPNDATMEASLAGEEEAFTKDETRKIAVADTGTQEVDNMMLSFFPTSEGYYDYENFRYIYQYKDHLGNVRVSYVKNGNDLQIMDRNDYYPFGMSFLKPFGQVSVYDPMAIPYNYKYNGKELQETGMYDYGARFYMPDIGRWGVVDPLAEKYYSMSPYNYTLNNPIRYVDPDGMDGGVTGTGTKNDPYVIKANYYYSGLNKDQVTGLNASIAGYNNGGNAREIGTKDGNIYVSFSLTATEAKDEASAKDLAKNDKIEDSDGKMIRIGNYITNGTVAGAGTADALNTNITSDGAKVMAIPGMNYASKFENDFNHEIGHNLGGVHGDPGKMMDPVDNIVTSNGITTFTGSPVTNDAVRAIFGRTDMTQVLKDGVSKSGYGIVESKYLNPTELTNIRAIPQQKGSVGRLRTIK